MRTGASSRACPGGGAPEECRHESGGGAATTYLVLIYLRPGQHEALRAYEREARPITARHSGRFELVLRPEAAAEGPDEVHLLHFDRPDGFEAFRADPDLQRLAALRDAAVERAVVIAAEEIPVDAYFGGPG